MSLKLGGEAAALCDAVGVTPVVIAVSSLDWTRTCVRGGSGGWSAARANEVQGLISFDCR